METATGTQGLDPPPAITDTLDADCIRVLQPRDGCAGMEPLHQ